MEKWFLWLSNKNLYKYHSWAAFSIQAVFGFWAIEIQIGKRKKPIIRKDQRLAMQ